MAPPSRSKELIMSSAERSIRHPKWDKYGGLVETLFPKNMAWIMTCLIWLLHQKSLSWHLNVVADFGESQPTRMEISIDLANKNGDVIQQWRIDWGPTAKFHWKYRTVWVVGILNTFRISLINRNCNIRQQNWGLDQRKLDCLPTIYSSSPTITVWLCTQSVEFLDRKGTSKKDPWLRRVRCEGFLGHVITGFLFLPTINSWTLNLPLVKWHFPQFLANSLTSFLRPAGAIIPWTKLLPSGKQT